MNIVCVTHSIRVPEILTPACKVCLLNQALGFSYIQQCCRWCFYKLHAIMMDADRRGGPEPPQHAACNNRSAASRPTQCSCRRHRVRCVNFATCAVVDECVGLMTYFQSGCNARTHREVQRTRRKKKIEASITTILLYVLSSPAHEMRTRRFYRRIECQQCVSVWIFRFSNPVGRVFVCGALFPQIQLAME